MRSNQILIVAGSGALVVALGWSAWSCQKPQVLEASKLQQSKRWVDLVVQAEKQPQRFVATNANSKDKEVQTVVTRTRIKLAYQLANKKEYKEARNSFLQTVALHRGTQAMHPDFGTLDDQARYQAIVCLEASGKKEEAVAEYRTFMKENPESPLIHASFRRLERLNNGKAAAKDEQLLQSGVTFQEKRMRFESSVCGPKCLERILADTPRKKNYKELARLCGTSDSGTTLEGLKNGAIACGLRPVGLELNAKDLRAMTQPAIWLRVDHYLAILKIDGDKALFFDPRYNLEEWRNLPAVDDLNFRATVLAFEVPQVTLVAEKTSTKTTQALERK